MRKALLHECAAMLVLLGVAGIVFWQTASLSQADPGQIAPATFPRLAAGALALMAAVRLASVLLGRYNPQDLDLDWSWEAVRKPLLTTVLVIAYYLMFGRVPFAALTFLFLAATFWAYDVRPWRRILLNAAVSTAFFYVLFSLLLRVPV